MGIAMIATPQAIAQKTQGTQDVHVINLATDPVPVKIDPAVNTVKIDGATNTVKIDGTANTVKAGQSGPWTVGISGTPSVSLTGSPTVNFAAGASVQIGNPSSSPALVRDVDRPGAQPFKAILTSSFNDGFANTNPANTVTVPIGKRLVIEFVTVYITLPSGQSALLCRLDTTGGFNEYFTLTAAGNDVAAKATFVGTHRAFVILEPGAQIEAFANRNSGTGSGTLTATISGYLVDI
jgi:hypothetical protein